MLVLILLVGVFVIGVIGIGMMSLLIHRDEIMNFNKEQEKKDERQSQK